MKKQFDDLFGIENSPVYGDILICMESIVVGEKEYIKGYRETDKERITINGTKAIELQDKSFEVEEDDLQYIIKGVDSN